MDEYGISDEEGDEDQTQLSLLRDHLYVNSLKSLCGSQIGQLQSFLVLGRRSSRMPVTNLSDSLGASRVSDRAAFN